MILHGGGGVDGRHWRRPEADHELVVEPAEVRGVV